MGAAGVEMGLRGKGRVPWVTHRTMHMGHSFAWGGGAQAMCCPPTMVGPNWGPPRHSAMQSCHGNRWGSFGSSCSLKVRRKKTGWGGTSGMQAGGVPTPPYRGGGPQNAAVTALPAAMHRPDPQSDGGVPVPTMLMGGPHAPRVGVAKQQPWGRQGPPATPQVGLICTMGTGLAPGWGHGCVMGCNVGGWELWFPSQRSPLCLPGSTAMATRPDPRHVPGVTAPAASLIPAWKSALCRAGGRGWRGGGPAAAPAAPALLAQAHACPHAPMWTHCPRGGDRWPGQPPPDWCSWGC